MSNIVVVAYGDFVVDQYYQNTKYLGYCGGGTIWNILYHLSYYGFKCVAIARYGNDDYAQQQLQDFFAMGVDIKECVCVNKPSKMVHVSIPKHGGESVMKAQCFKCGNSSWQQYPSKEIHESINERYPDCQKLLLIDSLNVNNRKYIQAKKKSGWLIGYDAGWIGWLRFLSRDEIIGYMSLIDVLHINLHHLKTLMKRLNISSVQEFFNQLSLQLLVVTDSTEDVIISMIEQSKTYKTKTIDCIDQTGAGDAFFAGVLKAFLNDDNDCSLDQMFFTGSEKAKQVIVKIGARGEIHSVKDEKMLLRCCENHRKRIVETQRKSSFVDNIYKKTLTAFETDAGEILLHEISLNNGILFAGFGASYNAAVYTYERYRIYFQKKLMFICTTEDILRYRDRSNLLVLFSYNVFGFDTLSLIKEYAADGSRIIIFTKAANEKISEEIKNNVNIKILSYNISNSSYDNRVESNFVSFSSTLIPAVICEKTLPDSNISVQWFNSRWAYWCEYFESCFTNLTIDSPLIVDAIYEITAESGVLDFESKTIESGIGRVTLHQKKNYSHGRFVSYNAMPPDMIFAFFSQKDNYCKLLIEKLGKNVPVIIINGKSSLDYLMASTILTIQLAIKLGINLKSPQYNKNMLTLYKSPVYFQKENENE